MKIGRPVRAWLIGIAVAVLSLATASNAEPAKPVYPLAPPGQGENGDWANLSFYRDANRALEDGPRPTVVFIAARLAALSRSPDSSAA